MLMNMTGIVCCDCDAPIPPGAPYSMRLVSVGPDPSTDVNEIVELICPLGFCAARA